MQLTGLIFAFLCMCPNWINRLTVSAEDFLNHPSEVKPSDVRVVYEATGSSCYVDGRPSQCMPPFTNIAEGVSVEASSTCGGQNRTEQYCSERMDSMGRMKLQCDDCASTQKFDPSHLTDRHQVSNETIWVSGPVLPGATVNLTLSLGKAFEVHYISLRPHGRLPDAITLTKSSDFGKTWQPWQYFSTDCYRAFRLPTSNERNAQISAANIQEVLCVALKPQEPYEAHTSSSKVIAFSTVIGRSSSQTWSTTLIDWMTMTDLHITLSRFAYQSQDSAQHDVSGLLLAPNFLPHDNVFRVGDVDRVKSPSDTLRMTKLYGIQSDAATQINDEKLTHFAFSDLAIGGRCKCNGHANRCVRDRSAPGGIKDKPSVSQWGPLRCDCQHNTAGTSCEVCAAGFLDRPWARATVESANECKRCDCNLHSGTCVFSQQIYLVSSKTSGGVCQECQHHTMGRKCHHCASGYFRDWTKPISHDRVCIECHCHSIGSVANMPCDRKTGQCVCKPGVVGQTCDRCQSGYKQTNLSEQPCVRATEHFAYRRRNVPQPGSIGPIQATMSETGQKCPPCRPNKKRIRFKTFCRREAVFLGTIESHRTEKERIRFEVRIRESWRVDGAAGRLLPRRSSLNLPPFPVWVGSHEREQPNNRDERLPCFCPDLKNGETYLFLTDTYQIPYGNRMELMLDVKSIIIPWREAWRRRLNKFVRRAAKGRCDAVGKSEKAGETDSDQEAEIRRVYRLREMPDNRLMMNTRQDQWPGSRNSIAKYYQSDKPPHNGYTKTRAHQRNPVGMVSDQRTIGPLRQQSNQPQFTYYDPYSRNHDQ